MDWQTLSANLPVLMKFKKEEKWFGLTWTLMMND